MRIKPKEIEINPSSPFDNDLLDRQEEIKNLTTIIQNVEHPLVLAINAPWGTGKTTFIRLWEAYLKQQGLESICFNAWETDFAEDPLIPLVSKLDDWVTDGKNFNSEKWSKFKKDIVPKILERSLIAGIKAATFKIIDIDKEYEKVFADLSGEIAGDLITQFNQKYQAIQQFKDVIKESLDILPKEQKNLMIFIDELGRCRPNYAIELLERVKHLFNIERLVFVLSTDTEQLAHSICAVYGNNFESEKYLKRFIDLDYSLKEPDLKQYIDSQFKALQIKTTYSYSELVDITFCISKIFEFKLRDINFLVTRIKLVFLSMSSYEFEPIIITLIALKYYNESLYRQYIFNTEISNKIITLLIQEVTKNRNLDLHSRSLMSIFSYFMIFEKDQQKEQDLIDKCELLLLSLNKENNNYYSKEIFTNVDRLRSQLHWNYTNPQAFMTDIITKIELLNRININ